MNDTVETIDDDDEEMDPDWVKTPMAKSRRKTTVSMNLIYPYFVIKFSMVFRFQFSDQSQQIHLKPTQRSIRFKEQQNHQQSDQNHQKSVVVVRLDAKRDIVVAVEMPTVVRKLVDV